MKTRASKRGDRALHLTAQEDATGALEQAFAAIGVSPGDYRFDRKGRWEVVVRIGPERAVDLARTMTSTFDSLGLEKIWGPDPKWPIYEKLFRKDASGTLYSLEIDDPLTVDVFAPARR
jgi:hypothetical protein